MIFMAREDMSKAEAIYYYIRNAFAHGDFKVSSANGEKISNLTSTKNKNLKHK